MQNKKTVIIWLFSGCLLIFLMVVIGGITRLTDSGLSMSSWKLIGSAPPISIEEWTEAFDIYKTTPEGKVNSHYILNDFKNIYFWEYLHRMMGRLLGIVFLIPFIYFLITKQLSKRLIIQSSVLLLMGVSQGLIGWWMVKSGLVDRPDVSHYRLAIHLTTAFLTCSYTLWIALSLVIPSTIKGFRRIFNQLLFLLILVLAQIIYGAFIAGLKAGKIYNTWPKMGEEWMPEAVFLDPGAGAQFIHRTLAIVILGFLLYIWKTSTKLVNSKIHIIGLGSLSLIILTQTVLGISTLLMGAPIVLALTHQILAFFLLMSLVFCLYIFKNP
ncbi:MAG: COX15/CtaA family protein [Flavobacteriales bacterium]|mgnify:CR=1 FL=1|nr:COX15/CtaA family protein [Flavobacteriales bacterium]